MGKNIKWPASALNKKGFVQNDKGDFVKVDTLVSTGKVEKIEPGKMVTIKEVVKDYLNEPRQHKDMELAAGFAMMVKKQMAAGIDPVAAINQPIRTYVKDDKLLQDLIDISKFYNTAILEEKNFTLPDGERITVKHFMDLTPFPAPRMTQSDHWRVDPFHTDPKRRQRKVVTRYFAWRAAFVALCAQNGFVLGEKLRVVFIFPLPAYLSKAKRAARMNQYHKQRPDWDNCCKSICDAFRADDGYVCDVRAVKMWGEKAQILIF